MPCLAAPMAQLDSHVGDSSSSDSSMAYTAEDWQAQLEEVLALHAIYAENFRVLHIPGQAKPHSTASSGSTGSSEALEDLAQLLESLIGSDPPPASAVTALLQCEALVSVELPAGQLQLLIDTAALSRSAEQQPHQQQLPADPPTLCSSPSCQHKTPNPNQPQQPDRQEQDQQQPGQRVLMPFGPPIRHLPPIRVQIQLPISYPSSAESPPLLQLQASWLDRQQQQQLQEQLQQQWQQEGPGQVCFTWLDHVKVSGLQELGISTELVLSQPSLQQHEQEQQHEQQQQQQQGSELSTAVASQTVSSCSVDVLAMQLLRYSAARELDDFNASSQHCLICYEQVPGSSCLRLPDCHHFYCRSCLCASAAATLDSGAVESMRCPEPSCRKLLPPYVVKELLGEEDFVRWEGLLLSRTLERMEDVEYCPRCETVSVADKDGCAQCPKCLYAFCATCGDSWHPGRACLNLEERVHVLGRRRRGTTPEDRLRDLDLQNQAMNLRLIAEVSKSCPVCGMATIKNEGCNKMTCGNCNQHWCWKCKQAISGYDHFKDNRFCVLFDQAEIDRWHAMLFANERAQDADDRHAAVIRGRHGGARLVRCPVCGQENLREGRNNLVRCWSCTSHFCCACKAWLRGKVGQHFIGEKACKQHGD